MSEQVGAKFCPLIVLPNYGPKIRSMHEHEEPDFQALFKGPKKAKTNISKYF